MAAAALSRRRQAATESPLLDTSMRGARAALLNITGGPDLTLAEVNEAAQLVTDLADPQANIIFGAVIDPRLQDTVRVTLIATGIEQETPLEPVAPRSTAPRAAPPLPGSRANRRPLPPTAWRCRLSCAGGLVCAARSAEIVQRGAAHHPPPLSGPRHRCRRSSDDPATDRHSAARAPAAPRT